MTKRLLFLLGFVLCSARAWATPIWAVDVSSAFSTAITDPRVTGAVFYLKWNNIETADGTYDWSAVDAEIATATGAGKKYKLDLRSGINTPTWVYTAGASSISIVWDQWALAPPDWPSLCAVTKLPVPWDTTYQTKFKAAIDAMAVKYAADTHLGGVKLTGVNSYSSETFLPYHTAVTPIKNSSGTTVCYSYNDLANLTAAGYTEANALSAFDTFNAEYVSQFTSTKDFAAQFIFRGFPSDSGLGLVFGSVERDFMAHGNAHVPGFIAQNNSWQDNFVIKDAEAYQEGAVAGDSLASWVAQVIRTRGCPRYWEIFDADITNPANDAALNFMYTCQPIKTTGGTW